MVDSIFAMLESAAILHGCILRGHTRRFIVTLAMCESLKLSDEAFSLCRFR